MKSFVASMAVGCIALTSTFAAPTNNYPTIPFPQRVLHEFPLGTWVENIRVRPNGNLLVTTSTPNASVYQVFEPWTESPQVTLAFTFDEWVDRLIGIGESTDDKYVVVGSRFDSTAITGMPIPGTWAALELSFSTDSDEPIGRLVAAMPEANLLQSPDSLDADKAVVLISDEFAESPGYIWRVDTRTGEYEIAVQNLPELDTDGSIADVGINGLKIRGNQLYWVNSNQGSVYRLEIDDTGYPVEGAKPETIVHFEGAVFDDFDFGPGSEDLIWATGNADNRIVAVGLDGQVVVVVGNGTDSVIPSPTAVAFGRHGDETILYISGRDRSLPVNGTFPIGGWVRAIDTAGFSL